MDDSHFAEVFGPNRMLFARTRDVAEELGHNGIRPVHLALVVLERHDPHDSLTETAWAELDVDAHAVAARLREGPFPRTFSDGGTGPDLPYMRSALLALERAATERRQLAHAVVHPLHVLLGVLVERARGDVTLDPLTDVLTAGGLRSVLVDFAPRSDA